MQPLDLPANQPHHFYLGGAQIAAFRQRSWDDEHTPEDWIGSLTPRFGETTAGLATLTDGRALVDLVRADPEAFFGPEHVAAFGPQPALLLKLLDGGQRLPVHCHPTRDFARSHLASPYGKTEAWIVLGVRDPGTGVHLGFTRDVEAGQLRRWVDEQDVGTLLAMTNPLPLQPGDVVMCPAGLPHSIDAGVFVIELQEPTDFSVFLEWKDFLPSPDDGHLGIGWDLAVQCVNRQAVGPRRLAELRGRIDRGRRVRPGVLSVMPAEADSFFRAEVVAPRGGEARLDAGFSLLVVIAGSGELVTDTGRLDLRAGRTALLPWAAGEAVVRGEVEVVRARPAPVIPE